MKHQKGREPFVSRRVSAFRSEHRASLRSSTEASQREFAPAPRWLLVPEAFSLASQE